MGLASSQARLLSLTSRQHTVEASAQRILSDKLRLSNESDACYKKYMDALENTALKTLQLDNVGGKFWIDGSINNLMRYQAPENTAGSVFYVQNFEDGKLYVPREVFNAYENLSTVTAPAGHEYTDAMRFATTFGITYNKVDINEDLRIDYEQAIRQGLNLAMTDAQYQKYIEAEAKDEEIRTNAQILNGMISLKNADGTYAYRGQQDSIAKNYETFVERLLSSANFTNVYTTDEINLLKYTVNFLKTAQVNAPVDTEGETAEGLKFTHTYSADKLTATSDSGVVYFEFEDQDVFTPEQIFLIMLNGGTLKWEGKDTLEYKDSFYNRLLGYKDHAYTSSNGAYDSTATSLISSYSASHGVTCKTLGDVLSDLFSSMTECDRYAAPVLSAMGKTEEDIVNYRKFKEIESRYASYFPEYEYVASDSVKAKYYEDMYNAIVAAGGCTAVNDDVANSPDWVENMIKSAQVTLTTWDSEEGILSRTSPSLNTDVKEVANDHDVEQAEQDYEAEMAIINDKDTKYDQVLSVLESERSAIKTEIDAIGSVIKDNVQVNFKVFS